MVQFFTGSHGRLKSKEAAERRTEKVFVIFASLLETASGSMELGIDFLD